MGFLELAAAGYPVRSYSDCPIETEKILKAGQLAPTAVNFQPKKIYVLKSKFFNEKLLHRLVDYATVYPDGRVVFAFRNGVEVSTEI